MVPALAVEVVKTFEGCQRVATRTPIVTLEPYVCPAGYWTIGYGHVCAASQRRISMEQAEAFLAQDLETSLGWAARLSPNVFANTGRVSAIVDFIYNLGPGRYQTSTLRRRVNSNDWRGAATEARKWVYGGGRKLPGLVQRREVEAQLLLQGA